MQNGVCLSRIITGLAKSVPPSLKDAVGCTGTPKAEAASGIFRIIRPLSRGREKNATDLVWLDLAPSSAFGFTLFIVLNPSSLSIFSEPRSTAPGNTSVCVQTNKGRQIMPRMLSFVKRKGALPTVVSSTLTFYDPVYTDILKWNRYNINSLSEIRSSPKK